MDTNEFKTLCLRQVYGAELTEAERGALDDYTQTADGKDYLQECLEMKDLLRNVAEVQINPVDHEAMVERFESTVRQSFKKTIFQPWWEANSAPIILGLMAGVFIVLDDGWSVINIVLLGVCVLWLITDYFTRRYFAKILSRPDLYEYAKASRRRSDRRLKRLPLYTLLVVFCGLAIAGASYGSYWGYQKYGFLVPAVLIFILIETIAIVVYQYRKSKSSGAELWDWWAEEIKY